LISVLVATESIAHEPPPRKLTRDGIFHNALRHDLTPFAPGTLVSVKHLSYDHSTTGHIETIHTSLDTINHVVHLLKSTGALHTRLLQSSLEMDLVVVFGRVLTHESFRIYGNLPDLRIFWLLIEAHRRIVSDAR